jgi:hypothetical protein
MARSRRLLLAGLAGVALLAGLSVVALGGGSPTRAQPGAIQGSATTTVQRRDLVETDAETGTLGYCDSRNVYNHLSGTVTWLPPTGATIGPDGVLYRVEGTGVYLLDGEQPVHRSFAAGMSDGADVRQLNRDLRAMGYDPGQAIELNRHFSQATEEAIERWQDAHGLEGTGEIEFGRIVFQPGPRRVETINLSVGGSAGGSQAAAGGSTGAAETVATCRSAGGPGAGGANVAYRGGAGAGAGAGRLTTAPYDGGSRSEAISYVPATGTTIARAAPARTPPTTATTKTNATLTTISTPTATTPATTPPQTAPTTTSTPTPTTTMPATTPTTTTPTTTTPTRTAPTTTKPTTTTRTTSTPTATTPATKVPTATTPATKVPTTTTPPPASSAPAGSAGAQSSTSPNVALVTTSLEHVVTVALETSKQTEARVGDPVQVTLPSTAVVGGHITSVASVAVKAPSSSSGGSSGGAATTTSTVNVEVLLDSDSGTQHLDQAPVSVAFAAQKEANALSIPVTALVTTAAGGYAVDEVAGTRRILVPVTPGLYAGGYVAIKGNVGEGAIVTDGSR